MPTCVSMSPSHVELLNRPLFSCSSGMSTDERGRCPVAFLPVPYLIAEEAAIAQPRVLIVDLTCSRAFRAQNWIRKLSDKAVTWCGNGQANRTRMMGLSLSGTDFGERLRLDSINQWAANLRAV